ncbi:hypothetical protein [Treponema bryantii]|uniref:hypothetical protein n=1 Tax=Treponema bryantii TaxID=163 RepID=UPI002B2B0ABC|nr:hypothetical protein TRBR_29760 [Treponema bryantii]
MEHVVHFEQERINVELYMEKLLDVKEECEYGSEKRRKLIGDGVRLVRTLIAKVYEEGIKDGRTSEKVDVVSLLARMTKNLNDQIVLNFLKEDNEEDTVKCFDVLLDNYEKVRNDQDNQVA